MQWVRKDQLTHSREGRTAKPKTRQAAAGVPRPQQRKQQWIWRPKQENKPTNVVVMTPKQIWKQIWVPKTQIHRSAQGLAWIQKDRQFIRSIAGHDQSVISKPNQQKPTIKTTKVWVPKQRKQLKEKRTNIGQQTYPQTVNLVSVRDWMSFIRHQQGYKESPTGPGEGDFNTKT